MDKKIMIWIQDNSVVKGELDFKTGTVIFFDRFNNILMKRKNLTHKQLNEIKNQIQKQLNTRKKIGFYYA